MAGATHILGDWADCLADTPVPEVTEPAFPPAALRFRALSIGSPDHIRVVILGQDPYHGEGQATGLAFSVPAGCRLPPSLRNIFREMESDPALADEPRQDGVLNPADLLTGWHDQGVLLLNTALSVAPGQAGSHAKIGWRAVTDRIVSEVSDRSPGCVFILWGDHAQQRRPLIDESRHLVLAGVHPSPLSAHRGFFGSRPFSLANEWLLSKGLPAIRWKEIQSVLA